MLMTRRAKGQIGVPAALAYPLGSRSVLFSLKRDPDRAEQWLARVAGRRNPNIAAVALANKNARTVWALLAHGRDFQTGYRSTSPAAA
jgi:transposase